MTRTQGAFVNDTGIPGGWVIYDAMQIAGVSANLVLTRNALGDYSLNRTAAGAETYRPFVGLAALRRLASTFSAQEQFGGASSYPPGSSGLPPYAGATQLTPATAPPNKGLRIDDVVVIYQVGVADLTAASLSLNETVFSNNVANAITNIPIDATALPLTFAGDAVGPYLVKRAVTTPIFIADDNSDITLELTLTMANTGTIRVYGMGMHVTFNYA